MKDYLKKLKSLGDETRVRILRLLSETEWLYVCEIVDSLEVPFYSISRHLKELENAGLVEEERNGKFIKYFLKGRNSGFITQLVKLLDLMDDNVFEQDKKRMLERIKDRNYLSCRLKSM
ncbi:MAG: ArsR/SmtB family transcription factor [Brevinematia bacterium]